MKYPMAVFPFSTLNFPANILIFQGKKKAGHDFAVPLKPRKAVSIKAHYKTELQNIPGLSRSSNGVAGLSSKICS